MIIQCPDGYTSRRYGGAADHAAMALVLTAFHRSTGHDEVVTTEQIDVTYSHIPLGELERNVVIIEHGDDGVVGYGRTGWDDTPEGRTHYWVAPLLPNHLSRSLFAALVIGLEGRRRTRGGATRPDPFAAVLDASPGTGSAAGRHSARLAGSDEVSSGAIRGDDGPS